VKKAWSEMTHLEREEFNRAFNGAYDKWADEIERLEADIERLRANNEKLRTAIQKVLAHEESGEGGWWPGGTVCAYLAAALKETS
jgi:SMC interacting uncharacterized protein involved in chromosome segregation